MATKTKNPPRVLNVQKLIGEYARTIEQVFRVPHVADKLAALENSKTPAESYQIACDLLGARDMPKGAIKLLMVVVSVSRYGFDVRTPGERKEFAMLQARFVR